MSVAPGGEMVAIVALVTVFGGLIAVLSQLGIARRRENPEMDLWCDRRSIDCIQAEKRLAISRDMGLLMFGFGLFGLLVVSGHNWGVR